MTHPASPKSKSIAIALVAVAGIVAAAEITTASAESVAPSATPVASASAAAATGVVPPLHLQTLPKSPGPRPKKDDWKKAKSVSAKRPLPKGCDLQLRGAWLKVRCRLRTTAAIDLLSGPSKDLAMWTDPITWDYDTPNVKAARYAEAIFPLTRGETRVLQWFTWDGPSYGDVVPTLDFTLSEQWLDTPGPVIVTVRRRR